MSADPAKIRRHVRPTVKVIVSSLSEMRNRTFDYGIVPFNSGKKGLGRNRPEWGRVIKRIVQSLNVCQCYRMPNLATLSRETHKVTLTKGITIITKKIAKLN
jgi:hypothetical protein